MHTSVIFCGFELVGQVFFVLVFSQLSLISFPKKAHVVCWPLQAVKHPQSCLFTLLNRTGESIGAAKVRGKEKRWEIFPRSNDCLGSQPPFSNSSSQVFIDEHYVVWCRIFHWPVWVSHPASVLSQLPVYPQPTHQRSRWEKENLEVLLFSNAQNISVLSTFVLSQRLFFCVISNLF